MHLSEKLSNERELGKWLINKLKQKYDISKFYFVSSLSINGSKDPFKILVATILSQNSTDKAAMNAYHNLEKITRISPAHICRLNYKVIASAIRPAGLHKTKAKALKELSRIILSKYDGDLFKLLKNNELDIRKELMKLPNVGSKTCDVLLVNMGVLRTVPVDTHISRIAKRLGLVPNNAGYEMIRRRLDEIFDEDDRYDAHLLLIMHGRTTCKAINPLCQECLISEKCNYYKSYK
ncbi:MAG: endonuclease III [Nitrososphaerota archaeon]